MNSGLDTETLVTSLVSSYQKKVDTLEQNQKRHSWKQDAWKGLNKNVVSFYNGKLGDMRFAGNFAKKTTTASNASAVSVVTGDTAMNATQKMKVNKLASSAYMSGGKVRNVKNPDAKVTSSTKLSDLGVSFEPEAVQVKIAEQEPVMVPKTVEQQKTGENGEFLYDENNEPIMETVEVKEPVFEEDGATPKLDSEGNQIMQTVMVEQTDSEGNVVMQDKRDENGNVIYKSHQEQKLDSEGNPVTDENGDPVMETVYDTETKMINRAHLSFNVGENESFDITLDENSTINDVLNQIKNFRGKDGQKFNANFDQGNGRIYIASNATGDDGNFSITSANGDANNVLGALGLGKLEDSAAYKALTTDEEKAAFKAANGNDYANFSEGSNAEISLNGVTYTSNTNTFEINGLTITTNEVTDSEFTLTTKQDTSGIFDMVKGFIKEYNSIINDMDAKYNAADASKYKMLTDEEKEAMSEKEVEEWETKIKDSLLRRDDTLYSVSSALKAVMADGYDVTLKDGSTRKMYMSDFGVDTLGYFEADKNERNAYHIAGDPDDEKTKSKSNTLEAMISSDPDAVAEFFSKVGRTMYDKLFDLMKSTEYSSSFTLYEDKLMATQYSNYNTKITSATETLNAKQDAYYAKFAKMESAMAKTNATQSNLSSYFG